MATEIRCAIYTRKSTEEGLEQDFNSLDAQREACAAFIASQKHEGWKALPGSYDDGGFSGGNANRPALQRLMEDIKVGKVNTIVVYKIDRLTRSLADFAKMVELFDTHNVTFVSVTQQFNTTTSMGRLTLNVLLSFAQFEREVTGERIRDKVAASKAKGIWMGGCVPLGYDLVERKLLINPVEAKLVRHIYERYITLKSANQLLMELNQFCITTKSWTSKKGIVKGGRPFYAGPLYYLLSNRIYLGEIVHKGKVFDGNHEAIIERHLWEQVHSMMAHNRRNHHHRERAKERSILAGLLFDAEGVVMTPIHSNKQGKRYRYYTSRAKLLGKVSRNSTITKIPAPELEMAVVGGLMNVLTDDTSLAAIIGKLNFNQREQAKKLAAAWKYPDVNTHHILVRQVVAKVILEEFNLICHINTNALGKILDQQPVYETPASALYILNIPVRLKRINGGPTMIIHARDDKGHGANPALVRAIAKGYVWNQMLVSGKVSSMTALEKIANVDGRYIRKLLPLAWLAPTIVEAVLVGREPTELRLEDFLNVAQLDWTTQQEKLRIV